MKRSEARMQGLFEEYKHFHPYIKVYGNIFPGLSPVGLHTVIQYYTVSAGERILLDPAGAGGDEVCPCMMGFGFMGGPFGFIFMILFFVLMLVVLVGGVALVVAVVRWVLSAAGGGQSRQQDSDVREELEFLRREVEALRRRLEER